MGNHVDGNRPALSLIALLEADGPILLSICCLPLSCRQLNSRAAKALLDGLLHSHTTVMLMLMRINAFRELKQTATIELGPCKPCTLQHACMCQHRVLDYLVCPGLL